MLILLSTFKGVTLQITQSSGTKHEHVTHFQSTQGYLFSLNLHMHMCELAQDKTTQGKTNTHWKQLYLGDLSLKPFS